MATISAVRDALQTRLDTIDGLRPVDTIPAGDTNLPAAVVIPDSGQARTLGPIRQTQEFRVVLLVSTGSSRSAQDLLDEYLSDTGTKSVRAAMVTNPQNLGLNGVKFVWRGWENYGERQNGDAVFFGADVLITVEN